MQKEQVLPYDFRYEKMDGVDTVGEPPQSMNEGYDHKCLLYDHLRKMNGG